MIDTGGSLPIKQPHFTDRRHQVPLHSPPLEGSLCKKSNVGYNKEASDMPLTDGQKF